MRRIRLFVLLAVLAAAVTAADLAAATKPQSGLKVSLSVSPSLQVLTVTIVKTNRSPLKSPYWVHVRTFRSTTYIYPTKPPKGMTSEPYMDGLLVRLPKLAYGQKVTFQVAYARKDLVLGKYEIPRSISYTGRILEKNQQMVLKKINLK